ncbi:DNA ligase [Comamonas sediminis]|uniref:DNA ligase n=1 Tax=Comamonas sediminis TaxID=1783360 RepID=UPI003D2D66C6
MRSYFLPSWRQLWLAAVLCCWAVLTHASNKPALWLAQKYPGGLDLQQYWVSEKYDGVRGYWDGQALWTRQGTAITAPAWYTAGWPATPMEGELWAGRGQFARAQSITSKATPADADWQALHFMVFDAPATPGSFSERLQAIAQFVDAVQQPWVQATPQWRENDEARLMAQMQRIVREGGEGLMLHKASAVYRSGRSGDVLKLKPHEDAEAQVVGHAPGRGKYEGMTGALLVRTADGIDFKLGSGLSDAQRRDPPAIGSWVTYRYRGLHDSGKPRFASFWRVREEGMPPSPASDVASTP